MENREKRAGVSIIIPAFNEEQRLPKTLGELQRYRATLQGDFEVIVVDDGSRDGTAGLVQREVTTRPWLSLLRCPHRGKGAAVQSGMLAARNEQVILCDADLSMPVEQYDRLLTALDRGCDLAIGSRGLADSRRFDDPLRRRLMSRIFSILVHVLVIRGVRDTQCGFKAFRRDVARDLFSRQELHGFSFDVEILFLARKLHYRVQEVGIDWYFNDDSRVRTVRDTLNMVLDLLRIRLRMLAGGYREPRYQQLSALADVRRLRIVSELAATDEVSVKELCLKLRASQPLVSWHLRVLVRCGLVQTRRQGRQVFCSLNRPAFTAYQTRLTSLIGDGAREESVVIRDDTARRVPQPPPLGAGM